MQKKKEGSRIYSNKRNKKIKKLGIEKNVWKRKTANNKGFTERELQIQRKSDWKERTVTHQKKKEKWGTK